MLNYQSVDLQFVYPENWVLTETLGDEEGREVSLQSPQGGIWNALVFPRKPGILEVAEQIIAAMQKEYEDFESLELAAEEWIEDAENWELSFFCLDFLVSTRLSVFHHDQATVAVLCQAETREFDSLAMVFKAITLSLRGHKIAARSVQGRQKAK